MIKLIVMDVDGTLTDGGLIYTDELVEAKKFSTKDAAGILAAQAVGIECMVITGRKSLVVQRRCKDLNIKYVIQGIKDKKDFLQKFMKENNLKKDDLLYIGDDLNDLNAMRLCSFVGCPADAAEEVCLLSNCVADKKGGEGAVREIIFSYLKQINQYSKAITKAYGGI